MALSTGSFPDFSATAESTGWRLQHTYAELPALLHTAVEPTAVRTPRLEILNRHLAEMLGLSADALSGEEGAAIFAGNRLPSGARPLAQAYAGHQYGHFTMLGDGRAILLGEQITPTGARYDVQLKGPGPTPYSRRGDGRASLGPMLREYLISEAMHALRIPTTRSLAVASTGENVWRQTGPLPGAVLTRVASSHIRVGTFEYAAGTGDQVALKALTEYTVQRHFPELTGSENLPLALLNAVVERQASLIAKWMLVGFVHGVMNTDNMAISGETIDYGPCAFMDSYDPATVFSSIDAHGRYAYGNQPPIAHWNLARFAEALLPLIHSEEDRAIALATEVLKRFETLYRDHWIAGMRRKLGLFTEHSADVALIDELLAWMLKTKADFTNTFAGLSSEHDVSDFGNDDAEFVQWHERWKARLKQQPETSAQVIELQRSNNPAFIPRNHLVEAALDAAVRKDLNPLERLLDVVTTPFDYSREAPEYRLAAPPGSGYQTFCGT
jgi:uncharacterized protein YdiU (UPF0061 family)